MRKNIFSSKKLTLDYSKIDKYFTLKKNDRDIGSVYPDARSANNLLETIVLEMEKREHTINYQLRDFLITDSAEKEIDKYLKNDYEQQRKKENKK
jgi:hypothetical protein